MCSRKRSRQGVTVFISRTFSTIAGMADRLRQIGGKLIAVQHNRQLRELSGEKGELDAFSR